MKPSAQKKPRKPATLAPERRARATVRKVKILTKAAVRKAGQVADDALIVAGQLVRRYKAKAAAAWHKVESFAGAIERGITFGAGVLRMLRLAWQNRALILAAVAGAKLVL